MTQSSNADGRTTDILVALLQGQTTVLNEQNAKQIAEMYKIIFKAVENPTGIL